MEEGSTVSSNRILTEGVFVVELTIANRPYKSPKKPQGGQQAKSD
jgi:hypothetical protein